MDFVAKAICSESKAPASDLRVEESRKSLVQSLTTTSPRTTTAVAGGAKKEVPACSVFRLNPKALQERALFGYVDATTGEWLDGLVALVRKGLARLNPLRFGD